MTVFRFKAIRAKQTKDQNVFSFAATPTEILKFSEIERVGRKDDGELRGFQRHQVAGHIKEIRDYLSREDALLPNAVIIAFLDGVKVVNKGSGVVELHVTVKDSDHKPGFVVDGQQRLTALSGMSKPGFQVFVSALICKDYNQLRQQFVLINNTRPLPKSLIYELLPTVEGLPPRFAARQFSARIVERLNFSPKSSIRDEVKQHTNPKGSLSDVAMQKLVMNSASQGAVRDILTLDNYEDKVFELISEYFSAVKSVFGEEWTGMSPRTSRLRHGAGLVAMGFVMEYLYSTEDARRSEDFEPGLRLLKKHTAWTNGQWKLSQDDIRPWNGIQNTPSDINRLSNYLVRTLKRVMRNSRRKSRGM